MVSTYSVADLKSEVSSIGHGTNSNEIINFNGTIYRAARKLLTDIDPVETTRIVQIVQPIASQVYDYPLPADVKGDRILDIRPQIQRTALDATYNTYNKSFDVAKSLDTVSQKFTVQWSNGNKTIRINQPSLTAPIQLDPADGSTTWTAVSGVTNIVTDSQDYVYNSGSLRVTASTTTPSLSTTLTSVSLSSVVNNSTFHIYIQGAVSQITILVGTNASNCYSMTATTTQQNTTFQSGVWNLAAFPWQNATVIGSPNPAAITFIQVTPTLTAAGTFKINNVTNNSGVMQEIVYYSKYLFRNATTGAFQETITSLNDTEQINLDTDSYNLLVYLVALFATQQSNDKSMKQDVDFLEGKYKDELENYKRRYPSQSETPRQPYYRVNRSSMTKWFGYRN